MTLHQHIKENPYLRPSNCRDMADIDYAIDCVVALERVYGYNDTIRDLFLKLWQRKLNLAKPKTTKRK